MKEIVKPALILLAITAVAAALLGVVESVTKDAITASKAKAQADAMKVALPEAESFEAVAEAVEGTTISAVSIGKNAAGEQIGYVITTNPGGFGGKVPTTVGIDENGVITGVNVITPSETPGLGALAASPDFTGQFTGLSGQLAVNKDGGTVQSITSATITSRTVTNGVNEALTWFEANGGAK